MAVRREQTAPMSIIGMPLQPLRRRRGVRSAVGNPIRAPIARQAL